jgi:hypothetical protein
MLESSGASVFLFLQNQKFDGGEDLQQDSAERAFNKLARTFAAQVEALKRYRGGGEQTMPRGIARARGGVWTAVQVGSILRRV